MDEALDRFEKGHARRNEDRENDRKTRDLFSLCRAKKEGDPERYGRQRVANVVDDVREECNRARQKEDRNLQTRRKAKDTETERTALMPSRDLTIERSTRPCEW